MLDESGYDFKLKFARPAKQETRKIPWYNPPWESNVKTNLGRKFLLVIDKCFPKNHSLNKIFNRHTLKLSYSCLPNMNAVISLHNKNMLAQDGATAAPLQKQTRMPTPRKLFERKRGVPSNSCHRNNNGKLCRTPLKFQRTV